MAGASNGFALGTRPGDKLVKGCCCRVRAALASLGRPCGDCVSHLSSSYGAFHYRQELHKAESQLFASLETVHSSREPTLSFFKELNTTLMQTYSACMSLFYPTHQLMREPVRCYSWAGSKGTLRMFISAVMYLKQTFLIGSKLLNVLVGNKVVSVETSLPLDNIPLHCCCL